MVDDKYRPWSAAVLQECAAMLADTHTGLTGSKIGGLLTELRIPDVNPMASKRDRLYAALATRQDADGNSKRVATFVSRVMDPARYVGAPHEFTMQQDRSTGCSPSPACGSTTRARSRSELRRRR